ncbi:MAG: NAD-dependent epimerase [Verrucomicrobium sp.]|nr:NAD-dependent epimerase [Verrucomicrobium sp.]
MKALVTGAAGFVGAHVALKLAQAGHEVVGVDNLNDYYNPRLKEARLAEFPFPKNFRFQKLDLSEKEPTAALFAKEKFTHIAHMAAQAGVRYSLENPHAYTQSNIEGFLTVLEGARRTEARHLVYASSSSVYGLNRTLPFRVGETVDHPVSLYAATKKANELMAHTYSHLYRIPTTGLRFFTVYGPWGRPDMAYYKFTRSILRGEPIEVYNEGKMERDFTYIDDVVEGVCRSLERPAAPDPAWDAARPDPATSSAPFRLYNIGNHSPVALRAFIAEIERATGKAAQLRFLPMQPGDVPATAADVEALEKATGFSPNTPLSSGIDRFVAWYRERGAALES